MSLNDYKLSCELAGHSMDVRAVTEGPDGTIISGSRDMTSKIWKPEGNTYVESLTMRDHSKYVAAVCVIEKENWICTGSNDSTICIYQFNNIKPFLVLKGHSDSVCSITNAGKERQILSGSWDKTAKLWTLNESGFSCVTFEGHDAAVWSVCTLKSGKYATGSADKLIGIWNSMGQKLVVLKGHTDCVRGLAALNDGGLLSCANDATIRLWNDSWECIKEFHGHSNYIYTISMLNDDIFVTGGEDNTIRMWSIQDGALGDAVSLPAQSVWAVTCLKNGDIVTGTSDAMVRVFTKESNRVANPQILASFELAVQTRNAEASKELGGIKVNELPGPEALLVDGKDSQTKLIRQPNGNIMCYQWLEGKWTCLGDVTGATGGSQKTSGRMLHDGQEYDYVFSIDIEDGAPPLKLPYNIGQDPYVIAQKFIHKHDLPQVYLEQVANFIITNSESVPVIGSGGFADPLTGEGRYVPVAGNDFQGSTGNADPFTGGSSYVAAQNGSTPQHKATSGSNLDPFTGTSSYTTLTGLPYRGIKHFPFNEYHILSTFDAAKILLKLQEFNIKVDDNKRFPNEALQGVVRLASAAVQEMNSDSAVILKKMYSWPQEYLFPVLDITRLAIRDEQVCMAIGNFELLEIVLKNLETGVPGANKIMAVRCLSNMVTHKWGRGLLEAKYDLLLNAVKNMKAGNVSLQNAISVLYLNLSISQIDVANDEKCRLLAECILDYMMWCEEIDAIFRSYQALGNLTTTAYKEITIAQINSVEFVMLKLKGHSEGDGVHDYQRLKEIAMDLYRTVSEQK